MTIFKKRNRALIVDSDPNFDFPDSQLVSASQFYDERYRYWLEQSHLGSGFDRKNWEYVYILNAIDRYCGLCPGKRGLGFGVGMERLPSVMVKKGCSLTVSDYVPKSEQSPGWASNKIDDLIFDEIVSSSLLRSNAEFREVDMNTIPTDLTGYDFLWSVGSLEHIGSREHGLRFIESAMDCLKPGGVAVHTTEFTLTSDTVGYDSQDLNFFCRKDIELVASNLIKSGHNIILNFKRGNTIADTHVDTPPYHYGMTLTAHFSTHIITSIGLIIQKGL